MANVHHSFLIPKQRTAILRHVIVSNGNDCCLCSRRSHQAGLGAGPNSPIWSLGYIVNPSILPRWWVISDSGGADGIECCLNSASGKPVSDPHSAVPIH